MNNEPTGLFLAHRAAAGTVVQVASEVGNPAWRCRAGGRMLR
jgi:hypothetical protein